MLGRLPPLQTIRYFEAAARLGSFKAAATELNVTQGAVSQQIRALELYLQQPLFERLTRKVVLTEDGRRLFQAVDRALSEMTDAVREIRAKKSWPVVTVQVGPFFSTRWLTPRLHKFYQEHPGIEVRLHHSMSREAPSREVDLTIRWGLGDWPAAKIELLVPVRLQPICSPTLAGSGLLFSDVQNRPPTLLHVRDRDDWRDWLEHVSLPTGLADSGPVFDEPNVCIEAAASGLGIAMGFFPFIGAELQSGRLVLAHERQTPCRRNYFCVLGSSGVLKARPVLKFYDWLMSEASRGMSPASERGSPTQRRKTSHSHQRQRAHS